MIVVLAAVLTTSLKPPAIFGACVAARIQLKNYSVHIDIDTTIPGSHDQRTYDVTVEGSKALVRLRQPASMMVDHSDRTYELLNDRLVAYDAIADERLQRVDTIKGSIAKRLKAVLGSTDDALTMALEPHTMKLFFDSFVGFRDWRVSTSGSVTTIVRRAAGTQTMFKFGSSTPDLREVLIKLKDKTLHWKFSFRSGGVVALHIPGDARKVSAFSERPAPPKFASAEAERQVSRMLKIYGSLHKGVIQVEDSGVVSKLWLGGLKLREDRAGFQWAFDGSTLTALNKRTGKFYSGPTKRVILSEYVVAVGGEVDPLIRRLLAHRVPFAELFSAAQTVTVKGTVSEHGVKADILRVTGGSPSLSLFVRTDNHLLESVEAETIDQTSHVQTINTRRYTYSNLGDQPSSTLFTISPGKAKRFPLPKLKLIK